MPLITPSPNANVYTTGEVSLESVLSAPRIEHPELRPKRTLPAEWAAQSAVQLTWPHENTDWCGMLDEVGETYLRLAYEIATRQTLIVVHPDIAQLQAHLSLHLPKAALDNIIFLQAATNDTWARDHAFLTVLSTEGAELLDFRFNGWGGKFEASHDNAINRQLHEAGLVQGRYVDCNDFELEGGAIESDGCGTLLTTEECLLNTNRRREGDVIPTLDRQQVEMLLQDRLGVDRVLWLAHGYLAGDDTDSHIDTLARLAPGNTILYVQCADKDDEHFSALQAMEQELQAFRTTEGKPYRLLALPMADACYDEDGERLPATYANFLIMNHAVLYPTYAQPDKDEKARQVLQMAFPQHEIVGVDCRSLIRQHGSLHCVTMQYPRGVVPQSPSLP